MDLPRLPGLSGLKRGVRDEWAYAVREAITAHEETANDP